MLRINSNPPNPFHSAHCEWIDAPEMKLEVFEEDAKSIITENSSPDVPFRFTVNPYRGCFHACAYCYARPSHQYLDFGAGSDFERKIIVKVNAPQLLENEFQSSKWKGDEIVFSGITDCYQPLEASYGLTRECLKICNKFRNPVSIVTKSAIIRKDIDVLTSLSAKTSLQVFFSIPFIDDELSRKLEPGAPRSSTRFRAMKELSQAGIKVGIGIAPVIPGLSEDGVSRLLERAASCGATIAYLSLLRLPTTVLEVFSERISQEVPERADKIFKASKGMRGGALYQNEFGKRMTGEGERWKAVEWMFRQTCSKLGLNSRTERELLQKASTFERLQMKLPGF